MLNMPTLTINDQGKSFWELVYGSVNQVLADHRPAVLYGVVHFPGTLPRIFNTRLKKCCWLFSVVISEHSSKNRMIISVVAAKIWYLKNVRFLLGHPVDITHNCGSYRYHTHTRVFVKLILSELLHIQK